MGFIVTDKNKRWPGGCLPWRFHAGLSTEEKELFREVMEDWTDKANVRFLERTTQESFVTFKSDSDALDGVNHSTSIGRGGGEQFVLLDPILANDSRRKSARHEIGHALGLEHEHKRCDRDDHVQVNQDKIKIERWGDFEKKCGDDVREIGNYDFRSVMHYGKASNATTDGSDAITAVRAAGQALLDDPATRRNISDGDVAAVAELHGGNSHIYQISGNGKIEKTVRQHDWSAGWNIAIPYSVGPANYLLLLKTGDGNLHIHPVNADGSLGGRIDDRDWTSGWTGAVKYNILVFNFFLFYKQGSGRVSIRNVNANGTLGSEHADGTIEEGWTTVRHFSVGVDNFLFFSNADTGAVRVRRINIDGKIGESVDAQDWSPGWTIVEPYKAGGHDYLFCLKRSNGSMKIVRLQSGGKIGSRSDEDDWSSGYVQGRPFEAGGNVFLLLLKSAGTGLVQILRLTGNGKTGQVKDKWHFGPGWKTVATYNSALWTYALVIKSGA